MTERKQHMVPVSTLFGFDTKKDSKGREPALPAFTAPGERTPETIDGFHFYKELTQQIMLSKMLHIPLMITGPSGSSKSEHVRQVFARLNENLHVAEGHEEMEVGDLIGYERLRNDDGTSVTQWVDGPVVSALRANEPLLIEEADIIPPGVMAKLNGLLNGNGLHIESTGEHLMPGPNFAVYVTTNTKGLGDSSGMMHGTVAQNGASKSRYLYTEVDYPDVETEAKILMSSINGLTQAAIEAPLQLVNNIRTLVEQGSVTVPFGLRQSIHWLKVFAAIGPSSSAPDPAEVSNAFATSFRLAYYNALDDQAMRYQVNEAYVGVFNRDIMPEEAA